MYHEHTPGYVHLMDRDMGKLSQERDLLRKRKGGFLFKGSAPAERQKIRERLQEVEEALELGKKMEAAAKWGYHPYFPPGDWYFGFGSIGSTSLAGGNAWKSNLKLTFNNQLVFPTIQVLWHSAMRTELFSVFLVASPQREVFNADNVPTSYAGEKLVQAVLLGCVTLGEGLLAHTEFGGQVAPGLITKRVCPFLITKWRSE